MRFPAGKRRTDGLLVLDQRGAGKFKPWILCILANKCYDACRKQSSAVDMEDVAYYLPVEQTDQTERKRLWQAVEALDERKDFMFVITGEDGNSYAFSIEGSGPEGMDKVSAGDEMAVTYSGELSVVDTFTGIVLKVEKVE